METNYNIQTGRLIDKNGKSFDITVILNFPTKVDYENAAGLDDFPLTNLIDFYFGGQNDRDTEHYVAQFVEKQNKLRSLYTKLVGLSALCPNDTELAEQIDFVKSLIVTLH
jgi:hypothetical protein